MTEVLEDPQAASPTDLGAAAYIDELLRRQHADAQSYVQSLVEKDARANPPSIGSDIGNAAKNVAKGALGGTADVVEGLQDFARPAVTQVYKDLGGSATDAELARSAESPSHPLARIPQGLRGVAESIPINPKVAAQGGIGRFLGSDLPETAGALLPLMAGGGSAAATALLGAAAGHTAGKRAGEASEAPQALQDANTYVQTLLGAAAVAGPAGMLTRPLGKLGARVVGDVALGTGQSLASQASEAATIAPGREIDLGEAARSGGTLGAVGLGGHLLGSAVERLANRGAADQAAAGMAVQGQELRQQPAPTLQPSEPLTPETADRGGAYFDPQSQEWRVPSEPAPVPAPAPEAPAQPERAISWVDAGKPLGLPAAYETSADALLRANKTEGKQVEQPVGPEYQFAEEFARIHGLRASVDVHGDPISLVYHEAVHSLARTDPAAAERMLAEIHAADPVGFAKHLGEYASEFKAETGAELAPERRTEEGQARYVERLSGYLTAAFQEPERLRALLESSPGLVRRVVDRAIGLLQKVGVNKWKTSQQKALVSLRVFAKGSWEGGLKPNRAAELALKIRDSFAAIEGRDLSKVEEVKGPAAEAAAPGNREQVTTPSQEQPPTSRTNRSAETTAPAPESQPETAWDPEAAVEEQIKSPAAREHLLNLIPEMGHNERGGKLVLGDKGEVIGRTKWDPKSSWWMNRPGKMTAKAVEGLVRRVTTQENPKITSGQREVLEFLLAQAPERQLSSAMEARDAMIHASAEPIKETAPKPVEQPEEREARAMQNEHDTRVRELADIPKMDTARTAQQVLDRLLDAHEDHIEGLADAAARYAEEVGPEGLSSSTVTRSARRRVVGEILNRIDTGGEAPPFAVRGKGEDDIDPLGFYSPLRRALNSERMPAKASGSDWLNIIRKAPGAKRDEIEWSGVEQFLEGKKSVTRQELQEYLRENEVKIEEVAKGAHPNVRGKTYDDALLAESAALSALRDAAVKGGIREEGRTINSFRSWINSDEGAGDILGSKFPELWDAWARADVMAMAHRADALPQPAYPGPSYRLPGGENYRELLLTLPQKPGSGEADLVAARESLRVAQQGYIDATAKVNGIAHRFREAASSEGLPGSHIARAITGAPHEHISSGASRAALELASGRSSVSEELVSIAMEYTAAKFDQEAAWSAEKAAGRRRAEAEAAARGEQFTQGHWSEPNVLAHMRTTDRVDASGKKTLFLEEVQSDWHQKGREQGYKAAPEEIAKARRELHEVQGAAWDAMKRLDDLGFDNTSQALGSIYESRADWKQRFDVADPKFAEDAKVLDRWIEATAKFQKLAGSKIPRAPFAETWHELAMRRAIRYAAENGYDQIAWTRGKTQLERYGAALRQAVDVLRSYPHADGVNIEGYKGKGDASRTVFSAVVPLEGTANVHGERVTLDDVVGSEMAKKIRADPKAEHRFEGDDLAIGGKGMQTFYDQMLPRAADKIARPWGLKAGETSIQASKDRGYSVSNYDEIVETPEGPRHGPIQWGVYAHGAEEWLQQGFPTREAAQTWMRENAFAEKAPQTKVHSLDITPEMRASVLAEGLPRFAVSSGQQRVGFDAPDDTWSARFRRAIVNDLDRIEVIEKAAPKGVPSGDSLQQLGQLFPGRTFGEVEKLRAQIWKPMKEILRSRKIQPFASKPGEPSASDFLYALAALKANDTLANLNPKKYGTLLNAGSGMSSVEADRIIQEALKGPKADAFREIQRLNRSLNTRRLEAWVSGELITPAQRTELIKKWGLDYVPFRTVEDPAVSLGEVPARSKGFNVTGKEFKKREGRLDKADSPLAFAFDTAEQALDRKERNRFGLALASWADANGMPHFLRTESDANKIRDGEFKLSYKSKGEQRWLVTRDKGLYEAFKRIAPDPGVIRVFDKALQFLHSTIIRWNPAFPFYNFPKDLGTAAAKVGVEHGIDWSAAVIKNAPYYARGAWKVLRDEKATGKHADLYREARDAGALVGWNQQFDPTSRLKDLQKAVDRGALKEGVSKLFDFVDDANRAVELGTRLAVYDKARRSGKGKSEAAVIARKVTADFAQRGTWTPIARRLFLFFGAGVQGTREASMAVARHPLRGAAAFGVAMASGYAFASLSRIFADEDENGGSTYDRMGQYQLSHKAGVMVGKKLYGIPLPWFWNVPYYLGVQAEQMFHGERTARQAIPDVLTSALEAMSPISGSSPMQALTPTLLRPAEEIATNADYAGNPIRPQVDPNEKTPPPRSEQAFRSINPALQAATRALNRWTGGNSVREGAVSISPADVEHVIKFLAGGLGSNSWRALETGRKVLAGDYAGKGLAAGIRDALPDVPIARAYVAQPGKGATADLYYKNVARALMSAKEAKAGEQPLEPAVGDLKALATKVDGIVSKLRAARNQARDAGQDTADLEQAMRELMASFNREVLKASRGSGTPKPVETATR